MSGARPTTLVVNHHLRSYTGPTKDIRTVTDQIHFTVHGRGDVVRLEPDERHATAADTPNVFTVCPFGLMGDEAALVMSIKLLYVHNDFEEDLSFEVDLGFGPPRNGEDSALLHPDASGRAILFIPGRAHDGPVPVAHRLVYEPNLFNLGINILQYVGAESHLLCTRSTGVSDRGTRYDYQTFSYTDPLVVFLMENKGHFDELRSDDIYVTRGAGPNGGGDMYTIRTELVLRIQQFFRDAVFPQIRYTRAPALLLRWKKKPSNPPPPDGPQPVLSFMVQMDYLVVSQKQPLKYQVTGIRLNV